MPLSKDRNIIVPQEELDRQMEFCGLVHTVLETRLDGRKPLAYVHTFGCQGNVADSERLKGLLEKWVSVSPKSRKMRIYRFLTPAPSASTPKTDSSEMSVRSKK